VYFNRAQFKEDGVKMMDMFSELKTELAEGKYPVTPKIKPGDIRK